MTPNFHLPEMPFQAVIDGLDVDLRLAEDFLGADSGTTGETAPPPSMPPPLGSLTPTCGLPLFS